MFKSVILMPIQCGSDVSNRGKLYTNVNSCLVSGSECGSDVSNRGKYILMSIVV